MMACIWHELSRRMCLACRSSQFRAPKTARRFASPTRRPSSSHTGTHAHAHEYKTPPAALRALTCVYTGHACMRIACGHGYMHASGMQTLSSSPRVARVKEPHCIGQPSCIESSHIMHIHTHMRMARIFAGMGTWPLQRIDTHTHIHMASGSG